MNSFRPDCFIALDLGLVGEYSAVAILEKSYFPNSNEGDYSVRHLERFSKVSSFEAIAVRLKTICSEPALAGSCLIVDQTAVGRPVVDLIRRTAINAVLKAVTITTGHQSGFDDYGGRLIPKKELVSTMQLLLQGRRLRVASALADADMLTQEMASFRLKPMKIDDPLDGWRDGPQDDLVFAVAIAAWEGERHRREASWFLAASGSQFPGTARRPWWVANQSQNYRRDL